MSDHVCGECAEFSGSAYPRITREYHCQYKGQIRTVYGWPCKRTKRGILLFTNSDVPACEHFKEREEEE